jgi:hypothetical protein
VKTSVAESAGDGTELVVLLEGFFSPFFFPKMSPQLPLYFLLYPQPSSVGLKAMSLL